MRLYFKIYINNYRYGTPNNASKEYIEVANFFLKGFTSKLNSTKILFKITKSIKLFLVNILTTILKILENYRNGVYISPRVLQQSIVFIEQA